MLGQVEQEQVKLIGRRPVAGLHQKPFADFRFHRLHHSSISLVRRRRQILPIQASRVPIPNNSLVAQPDEAILFGRRRKFPAGSSHSARIQLPELLKKLNLRRLQRRVQLFEGEHRGGTGLSALGDNGVQRLNDRTKQRFLRIVQLFQREGGAWGRVMKKQKETEENPPFHFAVQYHIVQNQFQRTANPPPAAAANIWTMIFAFAFILLIATHIEGAQETRRARVAVPVADLRKEPVKTGADLEHDSLEESQLLYGDPVEVLEEKDGWARVTALEQMEFTHNNRWEGYPGWVESSQLVPDRGDWKPNLIITAKQERFSIGTRLVGTREKNGWTIRLLDGATASIPEEAAAPLETLAALRQTDKAAFRLRLVQTARLFLDDPYYWGGRSSLVDCSGLVGLVYQANGFLIPRDAHEQWLQALPIEPDKLAPGDLIFLHSPTDPKKVTHVMLYAGEGRIIEGPGTGSHVREIELTQRLKEGKGRRISFGTYLP